MKEEEVGNEVREGDGVGIDSKVFRLQKALLKCYDGYHRFLNQRYVHNDVDLAKCFGGSVDVREQSICNEILQRLCSLFSRGNAPRTEDRTMRTLLFTHRY